MSMAVEKDPPRDRYATWSLGWFLSDEWRATFRSMAASLNRASDDRATRDPGLAMGGTRPDPVAKLLREMLAGVDTDIALLMGLKTALEAILAAEPIQIRMAIQPSGPRSDITTVLWAVFKGGLELREVCGDFALHDVGYFGCTDIENGDGLRHPEGGARIVDWLVGKEYGDLVRGHSGGYADLMGLPRSKLYAADKCAFATEMGWLYLWRCGLTGELAEYRAFLHSKPRKDISQDLSHREWFLQVRARMVRGGLTAAIEAMDPENRTGARGR